jgi:carbonic anhydrase
MCQSNDPCRRTFGKQVALAAAMASLSPRAAVGIEAEKATAQKPDDILAKLMEGNKRFISGQTNLRPRGPEDFARDTEGQAPPAIILGCADSRVPPEFVFDQPVGGLFVLRVAGNIIGSGPILKGSIEFAVAVLGARLIMVLGHSSCGACQAAIDYFGDNTALPGSIEGMVDYIRPVVTKVKEAPGDQLVNVIKENARVNAQRLANLAPVLPDKVKKGELKIVSGYYELRTGAVELLKS